MSARSLVSIDDLTNEEVSGIFSSAREFKKGKTAKTLAGKRIFTVFFEPSTRTKLSFQIAARNLGAEVIDFPVATSSVVKGESFYDTLRTILAMGTHCFVIRDKISGAVEKARRITGVCVVNAGDGTNEHPSQGLLDAFTIIERKGSIRGKNVLIVGDIIHSRVARSNAKLLSRLGANLVFCGPPTLVSNRYQKYGKVTHDFDSEIPAADVVMMLRLQLERQGSGYFPSIREYREFWGLTRDRMHLLKEDAIIMHPGPINRDIELDYYTADSEQSAIETQVQNGVFVRMAALEFLLGARPKRLGKQGQRQFYRHVK